MTCKRIAKLLSEQQDHELSFGRRLAVRAHLFLCLFCRRLGRHLEVIREVSQAIGEAGDTSLVGEGAVFEAALSPEVKSRMKRMLGEKSP